jgi:type I restriction enzyme M protein
MVFQIFIATFANRIMKTQILKMADNKKEIERNELHRTIWSIADEMRGSVDGWDFKSYILGMLFYRYISENITNYINKGEWESENKDFDYALLDDATAEEVRKDMVDEKGFFILPSQLFCNVCKVCDKDENLNETLEHIFTSIEASAKGTESEDDFKGLFADLDVNSNKLGATVIKRNEKLVKLLHGIEQMQLGDYQDNTIDAFGDAYEYLMAMYASNAGKSGGEFYTPQEVSELLTKLATYGKTAVNKVYDPACGSGSLLLKAAKILGKENVRLGFYGQEINLTTYNLCRINMFLHDIDYDKFDIACEDTLLSPQHWDDEPFEVIVSNPPYSIKWKGDDDITLINDPRYAPAGVLAPKSKADLAFIMHSLAWLATNGTASIVCFPGVMYRGGAEKKIRQYLIDNNYVDCIIQLPDNLFFGTSIATCIMVLKKSKNDNSTLFIDASKECVKITNNNKLTPNNIDNIVKLFAERKDVQYLCKLVNNGDIAKSDYNLSVSQYVEQEDIREKVDIVELNARIERIVAHENELRTQIDAIIKEL